jgi:hypothetical protein
MILSRQKSARRLAVLGLFAILAVAAFGFAASNTVEESFAGDGEGNISGFNVTDIDYELNTSNPPEISSVSFTLDPAPVDGGAWVEFQDVNGGVLGQSFCTVGGAVATCADPGLTVNVLAAEFLRVIAVD